MLVEDEKTGAAGGAGAIIDTTPNMDDAYLMKLIIIANYLGLDPLTALACAELAMRIRSITRNPSIRTTEEKAQGIRTRFHVQDDMTPEQKVKAAAALQGKRKTIKNKKKNSKRYKKYGKKTKTNRMKRIKSKKHRLI